MEHVHRGTIGTVYSILDGEFEFIEAKILETGKSSIVIQINAFKESHHIEKVLACKATFTFVSVKKNTDGTFMKVNHNKKPE